MRKFVRWGAALVAVIGMSATARAQGAGAAGGTGGDVTQGAPQGGLFGPPGGFGAQHGFGGKIENAPPPGGKRGMQQPGAGSMSGPQGPQQFEQPQQFQQPQGTEQPQPQGTQQPQGTEQPQP